ncbi:MAG: ABC transporter permease [Promethearchaeota archaeon]
MKKEKKTEHLETTTDSSQNYERKQQIFNKILFYLIPCWRDPEISKQEAEIWKTKSKRKFLKRLLNPLTILGFLIILFILYYAVFPNWLVPFTLDDITFAQIIGSWKPPSTNHPLGQTYSGWDVYGRLVWGARTALTTGITAISIGVFIGGSLGVISAYFGGKIDQILMRLLELIQILPGLVLLMIMADILGREQRNIMIAAGILAIPGYARYLRASVLKVKNELYIKAARVSGARNFKIMTKHILPNALSSLIVLVSFDLGYYMLLVSGLTFVGFGDSTRVDWGYDIAIGRTRLLSAPYISLWPGLFITLAVFGFILIGDGFRDAIDAKIQK